MAASQSPSAHDLLAETGSANLMRVSHEQPVLLQGSYPQGGHMRERLYAQANLGLLLDKSTAAKPLWSLFTSIDVFVLWMVVLLAVGFGVACTKPTFSALWGVLIPWLIFVGIKVGASALF